MKKALSLFMVLVLSYVALAVAVVQGWQTVKVVSMVFAVAVSLAILLEIVKLIGFFISNSASSILYVLVALGLVGVLSWYGEVPVFAGYATGTTLGAVLLLLMIRKLAKWAQRSVVGGEVFGFMSNYEIRSYISKGTIVPKEQQINLTLDYRNIIVVLKSLGFQANEAKDAAQYVLSELPDASQDDKIREAIKFLGNKGSVEIYKNRRN